MNNDTVKVISDAIDMIAKKLGVAVDAVYPILLKQARVDLIINIVVSLIGIAFIVLAIIMAKKFIKIMGNDKYSTSEEEIMLVVYFVIGIFSIVIGLVLTINNIPDAIQVYVNPEYHMFKEYIQPLIN